MSYSVQLSLPAKKQLDRLDQVTVKRLDERLKELALEPYSTRISEAVKMEAGQRTSRVGDWRIIYRADEINQEPRSLLFALVEKHIGKPPPE